jgi:hypothetical protein
MRFMVLLCKEGFIEMVGNWGNHIRHLRTYERAQVYGVVFSYSFY